MKIYVLKTHICNENHLYCIIGLYSLELQGHDFIHLH